MNGKQASLFLGISYRQLNYLLQQVEGLVPVRYGSSQGKARDISIHDLTRIALAIILKKDGYEPSDIQKAVDELNSNWDGSDVQEAGVLFALGDGSNFKWSRDPLIEGEGSKMPLSVFNSVPKFFYNVRKIAYELEE